MQIKPTLLDFLAFKPFGEVLEHGANGRHPSPDAVLGDDRSSAPPRVTIDRVSIVVSPLEIVRMERHQHSSQTFIPMDVERYLIVVAPPTTGDTPDPAAIRAFIGDKGQGITYSAGVWHIGMVALDREALFAVLTWKENGPRDTQFSSLPHAITIEFSSSKEIRE